MTSQIIGSVFIVTAVTFMICALCYHKWGVFGWFYHDMLLWHDGEGSSNGFDGCSMTGTCSKCGESVLMDGQGNWF